MRWRSRIGLLCAVPIILGFATITATSLWWYIEPHTVGLVADISPWVNTVYPRREYLAVAVVTIVLGWVSYLLLKPRSVHHASALMRAIHFVAGFGLASLATSIGTRVYEWSQVAIDLRYFGDTRYTRGDPANGAASYDGLSIAFGGSAEEILYGGLLGVAALKRQWKLVPVLIAAALARGIFHMPYGRHISGFLLITALAVTALVYFWHSGFILPFFVFHWCHNYYLSLGIGQDWYLWVYRVEPALNVLGGLAIVAWILFSRRLPYRDSVLARRVLRTDAGDRPRSVGGE